MKNTSVVGIDLAKEVFHLCGINHRGRPLFRKRCYRNELVKRVMQLPPQCVIAMEACGGSHYWARRFRELGYQVRLIAPQFVKPFVKSQKNDRADAQAIAIAASQPTMRFVSVQTEQQQAAQALHRVRERLIKTQTALINETRGFLLEFGIIIPRGVKSFSRRIAELDLSRLPQGMQTLLREQVEEFFACRTRVLDNEEAIHRLCKSSDNCKKLMRQPGIGPMTATAMVSKIGNGVQFRNGRSCAASLGLVPRQYSTGGKTKLGHITKCGDRYLRKLLIHGARAVLRTVKSGKKTDPYSLWAKKLLEQKGYNRAAVALANKNARIAWALLHDPGACFDPCYQQIAA